MLKKSVITLLFFMTASLCFAQTEHCPFDSTEAYNGVWKFRGSPNVSKDSLLYVAFGKSHYAPTISILCIYRSGNWLHQTTTQKFAEPVSGNWVKTIAPEETTEDYFGYFCSYPDASDCVWDTM